MEDVDSLSQANCCHTCQGSGEGGDHDGDEYISRVGSTQLCAINHHCDRYQGESGSIQHKEHDHRVGSLFLLWVDLLQLLHRLQAEGGGSIVESQHVGRDVHQH